MNTKFILIKSINIPSLSFSIIEQIKTLLSELKNDKIKDSDYIDNISYTLIFYQKTFDDVIGLLKLIYVNDYVHISNVIISKKYRNQGNGFKLMNTLRKFKKLSLEVNKKNITAINLYKKIGFNIINESNKNYFMRRN